ncbi:DNA-binding transcriptional regulator, LysR family [Tistlia consotensis]|uniref:DNA-binding transcriptional regulator, LysR family n=1 Tax=Tistlia consotensis USBA 355 TaxID=560819 RepID=A0A1Y6CI30_9PROT|nr:LysR family transcriptional regulator [Tistlia consotensis]SMF55576.1 DNA-binding transcriptional regulator, LysR family [Tistlia consotensis USBA 355]SNR88726.1 DNA-binding transcriptional regulator, LysR family [Tistlia consotensis]
MRHLLTYRYIDAISKAGSIRQAAEALNITPSALNRRVQAFEEELGTPVFERLPRGVRLNTVGELLIQHIRSQISDIERLKSKIADLEGIRRGHVPIACSQALLPYFLPRQITAYRTEHPAVTFSVLPRDRTAAEQALLDYSCDLALVFEPVRLAEFQTLAVVRQPVHAVMAPDHPLAERESLRLRDCLRHPLCLPTAPYGVRQLLEQAAAAKGQALTPLVQSDSFEFLRHYARAERILAFHIPIGLEPPRHPEDLVSRPIDERDVPAGLLLLGQLRHRALPVASARFADRLLTAFQAEFEAA